MPRRTNTHQAQIESLKAELEAAKNGLKYWEDIRNDNMKLKIKNKQLQATVDLAKHLLKTREEEIEHLKRRLAREGE
jgi:hypothetical protein